MTGGYPRPTSPVTRGPTWPGGRAGTSTRSRGDGPLGLGITERYLAKGGDDVVDGEI